MDISSPTGKTTVKHWQGKTFFSHGVEHSQSQLSLQIEIRVYRRISKQQNLKEIRVRQRAHPQQPTTSQAGNKGEGSAALGAASRLEDLSRKVLA